MILVKNENKLTGSYNYKTQNTPIKLSGSIIGKNIIINEVDSSGNITGIFTGISVDLYIINGTWKSPDGKKSFAFDLEKYGSSEPQKVYKNNFTVKNISNKYSVKFSVENRETDQCNGGAVIEVYDKKTNIFRQQLYSDDLCFYLENIQSNVNELNADQSPLFFDDFNFDGEKDLAIKDGNNSGYGGPSYDVYLFDKQGKKYILNLDLTILVTTNLGMFDVDKKNKNLIVYTKSGCCWHETAKYEWGNNKLIMIYDLIVDAAGTTGNDDGDFITFTERTLVKGVWQSTEKKIKIKDYYK